MNEKELSHEVAQVARKSPRQSITRGRSGITPKEMVPLGLVLEKISGLVGFFFFLV